MTKTFLKILNNCNSSLLIVISFWVSFFRDYFKFRRWIYRNNFKKISNLNIKASNKTFFILGSGDSVENITSDEWKIVSKNFSVGINHWVIHDFVPNAYSIEGKPEGYNRKLNPGNSLNMMEMYKMALSRETVKKNNPYIFMNGNYLDLENIPIPDFLLGNIFAYGPIKSLARNAKTFSKYLELYISQSNEKLFKDLIYYQGASIERLILLAKYLGFKKIVLLGVDLKNTSTFYNTNTDHLKNLGINYRVNSNQDKEIHRTADRAQKTLTVLDTIPIIANYLKKDGVEVYINNKECPLYPKINGYSFEND